MNLIDRDELELDTEWSDYYDGYMSYSQSQINGAPTVQAILLDKVKEAREEIEKLDLNDYGDNLYQFQAKCTETLDKLIAESEE